MNKEKYYTPSKEEFHVGFEYEAKPKGTPDKRFTKITYSGSPDIYSLFERDVLQVKCLDSEEIESLGFNKELNVQDRLLFGNAISSWSKDFRHLTYKLRYYNNDNHLIISIDNRDTDLKDIQIFNGTIKNKSELKKVLTMLGVEYGK